MIRKSKLWYMKHGEHRILGELEANHIRKRWEHAKDHIMANPAERVLNWRKMDDAMKHILTVGLLVAKHKEARIGCYMK